MSENPSPTPDSEPKPEQATQKPAAEQCNCDEVRCHRLERKLPVDEHYQCAYCLGSKEAIQTGDHKEFCDFDKEKDPVHFGFPEDTSRHERG
jgi:hypothetical protein